MRTIKFILVIFLSLGVVACGGGGYGGVSASGAYTYSISGTVSGGNSGNSGVMVSLTGGTAKTPITTVVGGSYSFTGLANGTYTVTPSRLSYSFTPPYVTLTVNGGNMAQNFAESP